MTANIWKMSKSHPTSYLTPPPPCRLDNDRCITHEVHIDNFIPFFCLILPNFLLFETYISAIAIAHDSSFKKDQDILVLPLDLLGFDTHDKLTQDVLKHFEKVWHSWLIEK